MNIRQYMNQILPVMDKLSVTDKNEFCNNVYPKSWDIFFERRMHWYRKRVKIDKTHNHILKNDKDHFN